ncbi:DeoR/GlpR family DNA-binding transcription regulator [Streptomyces sp. Wb2n-11]|uniref:DeoR/GlpR family DNA-binding transcription regulator n=1 Tax=Streptomyces sp. Wb2n-11 TaxID=1030533 RepID=UPI000AE70FEF|nr:DeoR/GlpR family DNA-binding transcription regulator [Streptomyces sp. Wb2n-11]
MSDGPQRGPAPRQAAIAEQVLAAGSATAAELADRFDVSLMTIHRDLDELERQGLVRKFRGGVTAQPSGVFESNVAYRLKAMRAEKAAVAEYALKLIEPGMAVMLDDSTSTLEIARRLGSGSVAKNVLLLDHSELGRVALHRLAPLSRFDLVLVDDGTSDRLLRDLDEHEVPYEVCPTAAGGPGDD